MAIILIMEDDEILTATHILQYLYCPRFIYFENVLDIPENQGLRFKVGQGRKVHIKVRKTNPGYLRKKIGVVKIESDIYLSGKNNICGIVDEILFLNNGSLAPLDYKYAEYKNRIFETYHYQLIFYAQLIFDNYNAVVNKGYLIYTRSNNKLVEVDIKEKDCDRIKKIIGDISQILNNCLYPNATKYKKRCIDCCYKNICEK